MDIWEGEESKSPHIKCSALQYERKTTAKLYGYHPEDMNANTKVCSASGEVALIKSTNFLLMSYCMLRSVFIFEIGYICLPRLCRLALSLAKLVSDYDHSHLRR